MFFVYSVPNYNPALGPVNGDKQAVSVYDRELGNRRTVVTTPEEADEFIKDRNLVINDAAKKGWVQAGLLTTLGGAIGAGINMFKEHAKATKLNAFVEPLNKDLSELMASGKSVLEAKCEALRKDMFKGNIFDLGDMFSEDAKLFKELNLKSVLKNAGMWGAIGGAGLTACFAVMAPFRKAEKADAKITKEFIEGNK